MTLFLIETKLAAVSTPDRPLPLLLPLSPTSTTDEDDSSLTCMTHPIPLLDDDSYLRFPPHPPGLEIAYMGWGGHPK